MTVRAYTPKDYEMVMSWLDARKVKRIHEKTLSTVGFIVPNVCAVWVYPTPSDFVYLENLFSNPGAIRSGENVSKLIDAAIDFCRISDFKFLLSVTDHSAVIKRAIMKGAKLQGNQTLITFQLK